MFEVRENEIARRKLSGGTAEVRTLEGTLIPGLSHVYTLFSSVVYRSRLLKAFRTRSPILQIYHFATLRLCWCSGKVQ